MEVKWKPVSPSVIQQFEKEKSQIVLLTLLTMEHESNKNVNVMLTLGH